MTANTRKRVVPYTNFHQSLYNFDGDNSVNIDVTFVSRFKAPSDFYAFDIVYPNFSQNTTTIVSTKWGTSSSLDGDFQQINPQDVKKNGVIVSNKQLESGSSFNPKFLVSDSIAKSGSAGDVIEIRTLVSDGNGYKYTLNYGTSGDDLPNGMIPLVSSIGVAGDKITGNDYVTTSSTDISVVAIFAYIRFYTKDKKINVLHVGDSLCRGVCGATANGKYSPLFLASQIDSRISPCVYGVAGQKASIFYKRPLNVFNDLSPSVVILPPYSPNDGSAEWIDLFGLILSTASKLRASGIVVILTTPIPCGYTGSDLTKWSFIRSEVIRISSDWEVPYIDFSTVLEDQNVTGKLKDDFYSDGEEPNIRNHPNMAGKLAEAQEIVRVIGLIAT